jgi:hypothetical protein
MNQRIRELLEQAGVKFVVMPKDTEYEKFAELIVRECADLVDTLNEAYDAPSTAGKFIKQHFGVEE